MYTFAFTSSCRVAIGVENGKLFVSGNKYAISSVVKSLENMECFFMSVPINDQTSFLTNDFFNKPQIEQDQFWSRLFGSQVFTLHSSPSLQSPEILECSQSVVSNSLDSDTNILFFSKPLPVSCYFMICKASRSVKLSKNGMNDLFNVTTSSCATVDPDAVDADRADRADRADYSIGCLRGKNERGLFFVCFN